MKALSRIRLAGCLIAGLLSTPAAAIEKPQLPPLPQGFSIIEVDLGAAFRNLELIAWQGRPLVGDPLYEQFRPRTAEGKPRRDEAAEYYLEEARRYLTLLQLLEAQERGGIREQPGAYAGASGSLMQHAHDFLEVDAQKKYLSCPGRERPNPQTQCLPTQKWPHGGWKGEFEFDREDSMRAFYELFKTWLDTDARKRVPRGFWYISSLELGVWDRAGKQFRFARKGGNTWPRSSRAFVQSLFRVHPGALKADRERARAILDRLDEKRSAWLVVAYHLWEPSQSGFVPVNANDWYYGAPRLYVDAGLKDLLHDYGSDDFSPHKGGRSAAAKVHPELAPLSSALAMAALSREKCDGSGIPDYKAKVFARLSDEEKPVYDATYRAVVLQLQDNLGLPSIKLQLQCKADNYRALSAGAERAMKRWATNRPLIE